MAAVFLALGVDFFSCSLLRLDTGAGLWLLHEEFNKLINMHMNNKIRNRCFLLFIVHCLLIILARDHIAQENIAPVSF